MKLRLLKQSTQKSLVELIPFYWDLNVLNIQQVINGCHVKCKVTAVKVRNSMI